jgi:dihydropteroate synthase
LTPVAVAAVPLTWRTARGVLRFDRPVVLGILNMTPDSFSDGGLHRDVEAAVRHARDMIAAGADIIDVGGESTRPGAQRVGAAEEAARIIPVIRALRAESDVAISVDTVKSSVAEAALDAGADIINDVSALRLDRAMAQMVARANAGVILMHSRGDVDTMAGYTLAEYDADPVDVIAAELEEATAHARRAGIARDAIVVDPGLGFAKRTEHSLRVLAGLNRLERLGFPVLVGPSRKRFIGEAAGGNLPVEARLEGTLAACVLALAAGARLFRVHDVAPVRRALDFAAAVLDAGSAR